MPVSVWWVVEKVRAMNPLYEYFSTDTLLLIAAFYFRDRKDVVYEARRQWGLLAS